MDLKEFQNHNFTTKKKRFLGRCGKLHTLQISFWKFSQRQKTGARAHVTLTSPKKQQIHSKPQTSSKLRRSLRGKPNFRIAKAQIGTKTRPLLKNTLALQQLVTEI